MSKRVALITGAGRGVGRATALLFAREGMAVALCSRTPDELSGVVQLIRKAGGEAHSQACDVSDEAQVAALFRELERRYSRLDVLVNNAGVLETSPVEQMPVELWDRVMAVNARGPFLCSREAFRLMSRQGGGVILNVSSLSGIRGVEKFPGTAAYVASKFALAGLTEVLAVEGKARGIRVLAVSPGAIDTELLQQADHGLRAGMTADELARILWFLASSDARPISGSNLEIFSNA